MAQRNPRPFLSIVPLLNDQELEAMSLPMNIQNALDRVDWATINNTGWGETMSASETSLIRNKWNVE